MPERFVLCVDDEPIILLALKRKLIAALGGEIRCETATGAESALQLLGEFAAAGRELLAVVSDWRMPGMGGDDFLRLVRRDRADARLILLSGFADREMVQALDAEIGLAGIFQKPCDVGALARLILAK